MSYDYKKGKARLLKILNCDDEIEKIDMMSQNDDEMNFNIGVETWITVVNVDIKNHQEILTQDSRKKVSITLKSFHQEAVNILNRPTELVKEIRIAEDNLYVVYNSPTKANIYEVADNTFYLLTYIKMLNKMLKTKNLPMFDIGIGVSTNKGFVIKTGEDSEKVNNKLWLGKSLKEARTLSKAASTNHLDKVAFTEISYMNFIEELTKENIEAPSWFKLRQNENFEKYYTASITISGFDYWIKEGMME